MSRTDIEHLEDAQNHFTQAVEYGVQEVLDQQAIDAICMRIAAGIDSLNGLHDDLRHHLFGDTWHAMWGMRNRIAHTYALVEASVIIATVRRDVPDIQARIARHLGG